MNIVPNQRKDKMSTGLDENTVFDVKDVSGGSPSVVVNETWDDGSFKINPYAATVEQIEEAFCFDMTVLVSLAFQKMSTILKTKVTLFSVAKLYGNVKK